MLDIRRDRRAFCCLSALRMHEQEHRSDGNAECR
jgi:hypothetical protein